MHPWTKIYLNIPAHHSTFVLALFELAFKYRKTLQKCLKCSHSKLSIKGLSVHYLSDWSISWSVWSTQMLLKPRRCRGLSNYPCSSVHIILSFSAQLKRLQNLISIISHATFFLLIDWTFCLSVLRKLILSKTWWKMGIGRGFAPLLTVRQKTFRNEHGFFF